MKNRKDVLRIIRKHVPIDAFYTFSDTRKDHQRVKFYGCSANVDNIQRVLNTYGFYDVTVESLETRCIDSVVLRFPYNSYK